MASKRFQLTWRNTLLLFCSLGALAAFFAFAGAASAMRDVAAATPSVVSDQADYNPGATVTLTGADWGGGEIVHVTVNDDVGQTWAYNTDITADDAGNFTLQFQLPNTFVANYRVTVTGASGATVQTTFTDSNPQSLTVFAPTNVTVTQGGTAAFWLDLRLYSAATGTNARSRSLRVRVCPPERMWSSERIRSRPRAAMSRRH